MEVEVYADLLFLINGGMDALCFFLTGQCLHRKISPRRVLIAAVLGGIYSVVSLLLTVGSAVAIGLDVLACLVMGAIVFARKPFGKGDVLLPTAVYCLVSMVLGGVMTALYHLFNRLHMDRWIPEGEEGAGAWLFALLALIGCGITLWGGHLFKGRASRIPCGITIEMEGRQVSFEGILDTGNRLRDPWSGRPVICVAADRVKELLSPALAEAMGSQGDLTRLSTGADARRLRLIPAGSALGQGMLAGFIPDRVTLSYTRRGKEKTAEVTATIAVSEGLTDVEALVPAELI